MKTIGLIQFPASWLTLINELEPELIRSILNIDEFTQLNQQLADLLTIAQKRELLKAYIQRTPIYTPSPISQ